MQNQTFEISYKDYARLEEKKKIKTLGNAIGAMLICQIAGLVVLSIIFDVVLTLLEINDDIVRKVVNELLSAAVLTVPFIIGALALNYNVKKLIKSDKIKTPLFFGATLLAFGANVVANLFTSTITSLFGVFGLTPAMPQSTNPEGFFGIAISIICVGAFPALLEEFAFRGIVLSVLRKKLSDLSAILISAIVFAIVHANLIQIPFAFIMGIFFAFITVKTNSVWPAVLAHFLNNTMATVSQYILKDVPFSAQNAYWCLFYMLGAFFAIFGALIISKNNKNFFDSFVPKKKQTVGFEMKAFFVSAGMIFLITLITISIIALQLSL